MTPEEIKENNRLIGMFMGAKYWPKSPSLDFTKKYSDCYEFDGKVAFSVTQLMYHSSWDWLMPVVEKIETYRLVYPKHADFVCDCKIVVLKHVLYREVVAFIKWYNSQLQQDNGTGN